MSEAPLILIADDSQISREYIANILTSAGYRTVQATDGGSALKVVNEHDVSLAIIDHYMQPHGGFEFAKSIHVSDIYLPMIMVTKEETADLLVEISRNGLAGYLRKPADSKRLLEMIRRALRLPNHPNAEGNEPVVESIGVEIFKAHYSPTELMQKVLDLALKNVKSGHGGPFGAIVADAEGKILGEGGNGATARADPAGHAEVMAIRQATEKLDSLSLENCVLYTSSEPTRVGKALIDSVGISKVYYGLSSKDTAEFFPPKTFSPPQYEQMSHDAAFEMMSAAKDFNK